MPREISSTDFCYSALENMHIPLRVNETGFIAMHIFNSIPVYIFSGANVHIISDSSGFNRYVGIKWKHKNFLQPSYSFFATGMDTWRCFHLCSGWLNVGE